MKRHPYVYGRALANQETSSDIRSILLTFCITAESIGQYDLIHISDAIISNPSLL